MNYKEKTDLFAVKRGRIFTTFTHQHSGTALPACRHGVTTDVSRRYGDTLAQDGELIA